MDTIGQLYTSGLWTVKSGKEDEFIRVWDEFAQRTIQHQTGVGFGRLLQELDSPNRFISFGTWESAERISEWRATPQFAAFMAKARELCDEIQPRTLKVVARS